MKKSIYLLLIFTLLYMATACVGEPEYQTYFGDVYAFESETEEDVETKGLVNFPGKIVIITHDDNSWGARERYFSTKHLVDMHGSENIIHLTVPTRMWCDLGEHSSVSSQEILLPIVEEIAGNPEVRVLILNPVDVGDDYYFVSMIRERRDDIFVIYIDHDFPRGRSNTVITDEYGYPMQVDNSRLFSTYRADLVLGLNRGEVPIASIHQARNLGAETFILFRHEDSDPEDEVLVGMRTTAERIGLNLIEVLFNGIECGSSLNEFMVETIPPLIEEHGLNTVLFGLEQWRLLWDSIARGTMFVPIVHDFNPSPHMIVSDLFIPSLQEMINDSEQFYHRDNLSFIIDETRKMLAETNMLGRVSSWPVSIRDMFIYAAVEYGILWMNGEVTANEIDFGALSEIMNDYIVRYSGEHELRVDASLFSDGVNYFPNHFLFLMDYLVY